MQLLAAQQAGKTQQTLYLTKEADEEDAAKNEVH